MVPWRAVVRRHFPVIGWLPRYNLHKLKGDVIAGVTVASTVLPQSLSYASGIALLPPQYGLYTAFIGGFFYFLMGTAKDIELGPCAVMSLLVGSLLAVPRYANTAAGTAQCMAEWDDMSFCTDCITKGYCTPPILAITTSLVAGLIQFTLGLFRLGFLVDLISHPVISGFTAGAAVTIVMEQIKSLLGLKNVRRNFLPAATDTIKTIGETKKYDLCLGLFSLAFLLALRWAKKRADAKLREPGLQARERHVANVMWWLGTMRNVITIIITGLIAYGVAHGSDPQCASAATVKACTLSLTGAMPGGLIPLSVPSFAHRTFVEVLPAAVIMASISLLETVAIGQSFARKHNYVVEPTQEFLALGVANIAGGFFSAFPVTASFSRTAINAASGVQTQVGLIVTSFVVLIAVATLSSLFYYIPAAALGAIIIVAVLDLINFQIVSAIWKMKRWDVIPWAATFLTVLFASVEIGILVGLVVSFLPALYHNLRPRAALLGMHRTHGTFQPIELPPVRPGLPSGKISFNLIWAYVCDVWADVISIYAPEHGPPNMEVVELAELKIVRMGGSLSFLSVNFALSQLQELVMGEIATLKPRPYYDLNRSMKPVPPHAVAIDCSKVDNIDFTAGEALALIVQRGAAAGVHVYLVAVSPDVQQVLAHTSIGRHAVFVATLAEAAAQAKELPAARTSIASSETAPLVGGGSGSEESETHADDDRRPLVLFDTFDGSFVTYGKQKRGS
eukprot:m.27294 g.27294  ORF g.27294 m.27294 type:complete len:734 (-) comp9005_c0_seq1:113-2314(-)